VQQLAAQLPWGHLLPLQDGVKVQIEREWYARATIEHGRSRNVLAHQIDGGLFNRQGHALTNFDRTMPPPDQSELAQQLIKDPYNFDFLSLAAEAKERAIERGMIGMRKTGRRSGSFCARTAKKSSSSTR
jgi:predicted nuclease of restriction endonuclease-like (RecB) superfamily